MADKKYKALFVLDPTHRKVVVEAKKMRMTVDRLVSDMFQIYGKRKSEVK